jgi:flagellar motor switch protein FliN/FliY
MDQNELDRLMNEMSASAEAGNDEKPKSAEDENLSWDDVQQEMDASRKETPKTEVSEVSFGELTDASQKKGPMNLDFILDIPLTLTVELGRNRLLINELLQLGQGSVIELTKLAGEPMDIYVNQRLIARGEVVVVNEKFGVRLTDIVSPAERVNRLK